MIFDFCDEKKPQVYPMRYIEDFFSSQKFGERRKIRFRSREGFCRPSLEKDLTQRELVQICDEDRKVERMVNGYV